MKKYKPKRHLKNKKIQEYIIDETAIKAGSELIWLWVIIEPKHKEILEANISKERNMFVAERFLSEVVKRYEYVLFHQMVVHGTHKHVDF